MDYFSLSFWQGVGSSLFVFIVLALITPIKNKIIDYMNKRNLKKLKQKLDILKWEKEHLEKIKKSSVALSRTVYLDIFWLLLFLSIGLGIPILGHVVEEINAMYIPIVKFLLPFSVPIWIVSIMIAIQNIKKFKNLNNYSKAIGILDSKIETVGNKIAKIVPGNISANS